MKKKLIAISLLCLLAGGTAFAGEYANALGKCLYKNSSSQDKTVLTQWAFVSLGQTDAAKSITTIPANKTQEVDQKAKSVVTRLIGSSCSSEALKVALHEPTTGIQNSISAITSEMIAEKIKARAGSTFSGSMLSSGSSNNTTSRRTLGDFFKK